MGRLDSVPLFDELADGYDDLLPFFSTFGRRLVDLINPPAGTDFMDIGAGRGAVSVPALARGCRVVAIDAAPRMVQRLSLAQPDLDVRLMDAHDLRLPDDSFDVAAASFVIHCLDDPCQVVRESVRVVRPGGLVAMSVPRPCDDGGRWDRFNAIGDAFRPVAGAAEVARPTDVHALFSAAGLTELRRESIEVHLPVDSPQRLWDFQMSHGFAGYIRSFTRPDQQEFHRRAMAELQRMHDDHGIDLHRCAAVTLGRVPDEPLIGRTAPGRSGPGKPAP